VPTAGVKKPANLLYGSDDKPPTAVTALTGLQHAGVNAIFLLIPLLVCREGGLTPAQIVDVLSAAMLLQAAVTAVQAYPVGPIGAGLFCPAIYTAAYLGPSLAALKIGGLPLVFGMTLFAGLVQCALARLLPYLRALFPSEVAGLIIILIGFTNGTIGVRYLLGVGEAQVADATDLSIGFLSLAVMVALNVWTKGPPRVFCGMIGLALGYAVAAALGRLGADSLQALVSAPVAHVPRLVHVGWSFDAALSITFAVAALSTTTKAMGIVTSYQKLNDAAWTRPDMRSVSGGVLADGLGTAAAGLVGSTGMNPSASSLGLATATGVASRPVSLAVAGVFVVLAFLPKAAMLFAIMPRAVIGAALVFTAAFVLVNGIEVVTSRILDARRALMIGLALTAAASVDVFPGFFATLPPALRPFFVSSLAAGTLVALALNAIFRLGVRQARRLEIDPAQVDPEVVHRFLEEQGARWGARRDVIERAGFNLAQSVETIVESCAPEGRLEVEASFDEFNLDVRISYPGAMLEFPAKRPTTEEILTSEDGQRKLAGFLLRRQADRVQATQRAGRATVLFHFDH
jgi:NCS2 family nucleobase:cation symporter-2